MQRPYQNIKNMKSEKTYYNVLNTNLFNRFGFIVMDGNGALFGTLQGNTRDVLHKFTVDLPKVWNICKKGRISKRYILFSNNNVYIHITETRSGWSIGSKICSITYGKTSQLCSKGKHLKYIAHYLETHGNPTFKLELNNQMIIFQNIVGSRDGSSTLHCQR